MLNLIQIYWRYEFIDTEFSVEDVKVRLKSRCARLLIKLNNILIIKLDLSQRRKHHMHNERGLENCLFVFK